MPASVVVYGAGGHGKVVADIVQHARGLRLLGFLDDGHMAGTVVMGLRVLGGKTWLESKEGPPVLVALGIGNGSDRSRVADLCGELGIPLVTVVHPKAAVAPSASVGTGTVVMANASINAEARVGRGAIVNTGAVVEHDCVLGDFTHISPNAALGGGVSIGPGSHLGLGAVVLPGKSVGAGCIVGAGAVVTMNVDDGLIVAGVPARVVRRLK